LFEQTAFISVYFHDTTRLLEALNMIKKIAIFGVLGLLLLGAGTAFAQRGAGGMGQGMGMGPMPENARIVKGTIDRLSGDYVSITVEDIFVPREGPMENPPDTVRVSIGDETRFVTKEGRDSELSDFSKGDMIVAITVFEDGKYTLRCLATSDVAAGMRQKMGQRIKERRHQQQESRMRGPGGRFEGQRGQGMMGRQQQPPMLVGTFEGYDKDGVTIIIKGVLVPSGEGKRDIKQLPEEKTVTVRIFDRTRFFHGGEKASIDDFSKGEGIVAMIPRRGAGRDEGPMLMLLADKASVEKLRDLMRGMRDGENRRDRERARDGSCDE
jgi:plastocyanin